VAQEPALVVDDHRDDTNASEACAPIEREHLTARELLDALVDRARLRIRWIGAGRLLGGAGAALVIAGLGWWLLRSPALPTEAALPVATHPDDAATTTTSIGATPAAAVGTSDVPSSVLVHVAGAVTQPGVYELSAGARVADAVAAAGGATTDADPNALNLAAPVVDGDRIEVPVAGAARPPGPEGAGHSHASVPGSNAGSASGPVDLNAATTSELDQLPGIGPATAAAIVEYREQNGPFATVDDLLDVPGIGPAKLDAVRDAVTT
jgi:competence protein ComEA